MSLKMSEISEGGTGGGGRVEEGTHVARIGAIVEIGVQPMEDHITHQPKPSQPRVIFSYVFPTMKVEYEDKDGAERSFCRSLYKEYTVSKYSMSNLAKLLNGLGKNKIENLNELLGMAVMVSVGTTSGGKAKVAGVMPMVSGMDAPELGASPYSFDFDEPTEKDFFAVPSWLQNKIVAAENYTGFVTTFQGEDVPFDATETIAQPTTGAVTKEEAEEDEDWS